jgi:pimeloyl-ACP methyl ester carboxylesterase
VSSLVTRVVLVHGSVGNAEMAWGHLVEPLREHYEVVLHTRSGYPPRPPEQRIDFEQQADELAAELRPGDHLAGHSYGGVVSLLAAARNPVLASLTVSEPPAFGVARGNPVVEEFIAKFEEIIATDPSPRDYLAQFAPLVGSTLPTPETLPPPLEQGAQAALAERPPFEAEIPLDALAATRFPKLVISGAHGPAFDAVCAVLEKRLRAERAIVAGAGHSIPRAPGYYDTLVSFVERVP